MEKVDVLVPPDFQKSGVVKTKNQAIRDGDWLGVFHLWVIQRHPVPSIIYQQRSSKSSLCPNMLDVTVGGHYQVGESRLDGLREVKEELGVDYDPKKLTYLGRKLYFGIDEKKFNRQTVVDIHMVEDNRSLNQFIMEASEVSAICICPIEYLIKVHLQQKPFQAPAIASDGRKYIIDVTPDIFPYNWDPYHLKIALLAKRFINGERNMIY